jgi:hypothetical protein
MMQGVMKEIFIPHHMFNTHWILAQESKIEQMRIVRMTQRLGPSWNRRRGHRRTPRQRPVPHWDFEKSRLPPRSASTAPSASSSARQRQRERERERKERKRETEIFSHNEDEAERLGKQLVCWISNPPTAMVLSSILRPEESHPTYTL